MSSEQVNFETKRVQKRLCTCTCTRAFWGAALQPQERRKSGTEVAKSGSRANFGGLGRPKRTKERFDSASSVVQARFWSEKCPGGCTCTHTEENSSGAAQDRTRAAQDGPKSGQERPKNGPRAAQERNKNRQEQKNISFETKR